MHRTLRAIAGALALTLALSVSALAADSTGTTAESGISGPSVTVSMVVPASVTYTVSCGGTCWTASVGVSNLQTNNPIGMKVEMTTSPFTSGASTVPTTVRSRDLQIAPVGWDAISVVRAVGFYGTSATVDLLASRGTATTVAGSTGFVMRTTNTLFTQVGGAYTGTLSFTASTN